MIIPDAFGRLISANMFHFPIFVVGAGRSGTSVLLQALGHHPQIYAAPGEAPLLNTLGVFPYMLDIDENYQYRRDSLKLTRSYLYSRLRQLCFEIAIGPHYGLKRLTLGLLRKATSPIGRRFWAAKCFPSQSQAQGLRTLYPAARFVYIVRNGCEVIHSRTKFSGFARQSFRKHCESWAASVSVFRYLNSFPAAAVVRHELLVTDPEQFFESLFGKLSLPVDSGPADFALNTIVHPLDQQTVCNASAGKQLKNREPAYATWSAEQKATFSEICARGMEELGFEMPF